MATRLFILCMGLFYSALGVCGFIAPLLTPPPDRIQFQSMAIVPTGYGFLFGFLPINLPHNILYLLIGVTGVAATVTYAAARRYSQALCVLMIVMVFIGFSPFGVRDLWGFMPLFSWNVFLHTVSAVLCWYFGFIYDRDQMALEP
jgi:hypothetical protein